MRIDVERVNWFSTYRVHHRVADQFRKGRAFLLGDAAHIHSPVGGQGMNTGIGDAVNLAWKLAAVVKANGRIRVAASTATSPSASPSRSGWSRRPIEAFTGVTQQRMRSPGRVRLTARAGCRSALIFRFAQRAAFHVSARSRRRR